jgi:glycosyltransferase involved in cell wall biosynthesis
MNSEKIKILHLSTHNEDCGVGKYQEQFINSMKLEYSNIENEFFEYSPNVLKKMTHNELDNALRIFKDKIKTYDALHIQHEFSFFPRNEFLSFSLAAKRASKKLIITYHTSPSLVIKPSVLRVTGIRSFIKTIRAYFGRRKLIKSHIYPAQIADMVLVHNDMTKNSLIDLGVSSSKIHKINLPVPVRINIKKKNTKINEELRTHKNDIIIGAVGFLHKYKGTFDAVKALKLLPDNYKLAIIGGVNPESHDQGIYNRVSDHVMKLDLIDRVYITGFIKEDNDLSDLISDTDICVFPYDGYYYSGVSSAALNLAFSSQKPIICYPTLTFAEIEQKTKSIITTNGFSYNELAKSIKAIDIKEFHLKSKEYAENFSYEKISKQLISLYSSVIAK